MIQFQSQASCTQLQTAITFYTALVQAQCEASEASCKKVQGERDAALSKASSLEQRLGDTTAKLDAAQAEVAKLQAQAKAKQVRSGLLEP